MPNNISTENNIVIVTGATGNLGHAVVQKFLAEKFLVIGTITENDKKNLPINNFEKKIG